MKIVTLSISGIRQPAKIRSMFPLRVGLFGIGLDAYWRQFAGLKERLEQNVRAPGAKTAATRGRNRELRSVGVKSF
jgi:hypothetical protein